MCSNDTQIQQSIKWPVGVQCIPSMGECLNGECVCRPGYRHDLTYVRFRNCSFPPILFYILFPILLIFNLLIFFAVYKEYSLSKATAKLIIIANTLMSIFYLIFLCLQIGYGFHMNGVSLIFFYLFSSFSSSVAPIQVYSLVSPLYAVAFKSTAIVARSIGGLFVFFKLVQLVPILVAAVKYGDFTNEDNDRGWNNMLLSYAFIIGFEACVSSLWVIYDGTKMINLVQGISKNITSDLDGATKSKTLEYSLKVEKLVKDTRNQVFSIVLILLTFPILYFSTGYLPFNYVFYALSIAFSPAGSLLSMQYVSKLSKKNKDGSGSNQSPDKLTSSTFPKHQAQNQIQVEGTPNEKNQAVSPIIDAPKSSSIIPAAEE